MIVNIKKLRWVLEKIYWEIIKVTKDFIFIRTSIRSGGYILAKLRKDNIVASAYKRYESFDVVEDIEKRIIARYRGVEDIPEARQIIKDAKEIKELYYELYKTLDEKINKILEKESLDDY